MALKIPKEDQSVKRRGFAVRRSPFTVHSFAVRTHGSGEGKTGNGERPFFSTLTFPVLQPTLGGSSHWFAVGLLRS
jgi:hypothetical protein